MFKHTRFGWFVALTLMGSILLAACDSNNATPPPTTATVATTTAAKSTIVATVEATPTTSNEIRIGLMGPFTGDANSLGNAIKGGVEIAIEEANASGGINGRKIVAVERDDKGDADTGVNNLKDLLDKEKVFALIGTGNSGVGIKQAPIVNQAKVPWIIPVASVTNITRDTTSTPNYVFRVSMRDDEQAAFAASYALNTLKAQKIALLYDDSDFGNLGRSEILRVFTEKNTRPVMFESFKYNDTEESFKLLLTRVKQAGADAIVMWCPGLGALNIRKALKDLGLNIPTIGSWNLSMPPFTTNTSGLEEGALLPQSITVDSTNPKAKEFFDKYKKKYNTTSVNFPSGLAQSYDAMNLMIAALKQPGALDSRDKLRNALVNLASYEGIIKKYERPFGSQYQEALNQNDFFMTLWKGGKLINK